MSFFSYFLAAICVIPFLVLVLLISLLLTSLDCVVNDGQTFASRRNLLDCLFKCFFLGNLRHAYLYYACLFLMLAYLFIPMGSLPTYAYTPVDSLALVILLCLAQSFYLRGIKHYFPEIHQKLDDTELSALSRFSIAFIAADSCLAWFILNRGVPGSIFSLDTITAMPLWPFMGIYGRIGLACLFFLLAFTSPSRGSGSVRLCGEPSLLEPYDALRSNICPAIVVSMFFPWSPGISFGLHGYAMFSMDFVFFWCKVLALQVIVFPRLRWYYLMIGERFSDNIKYAVGISLCASGFILVLIDIYL